MHLDTRTLFLVLILTGLALSIAVGWTTQRRNDDGLDRLTAGLALLSLGYGSMLLRPVLPEVLSIVTANCAISAAHALLLSALGRLNRRPPPAAALYLPPLATAVLVIVLLPSMQARAIATCCILALQDALVLQAVHRERRDTPERGRHILAAAIWLNLIITLLRIALAVGGDVRYRSIYDNSPVLTVLYLAGFCSLLWIGFGYVLLAKERADDAIRLMAQKDHLTGCWNRIRIEQAGRSIMTRLQRDGRPASLLMLDIDHFKSINDLYGHASGDRVLQRFSAVVAGCLRADDLLGRWGGEEFIVLLPGCDGFAARRLAERIKRALEQTPLVEGLQVTASLGISACLSTDHWEAWLDRADRALYRAKENGRNRIESELSPLLSAVDSPLPTLVWNDACLTGNAEIDRQHQALIDQANALIRLLDGSDSARRFAAAAQAYAGTLAEHMAAEETLLGHHDHPDAAEHQKLHRQLAERALDLVARVKAGTLEPAALLYFLVHEATAQHLLLEDVKLAPPPPAKR